MGGLRLLAAEPAPHPGADAHDLILPQPEAVRDEPLDLAGVLRRGMDGDQPPAPRDRERRLGFEVEVVLTPGAERPLDDVVGPGEAGLDVPPRDPPRRPDELPAGDRLVDGQDGRQFLDDEPHGPPRLAERRATFPGEHHDGLADVGAHRYGQQFLVVENRPEGVVAGHVGVGEHGRDPLDPGRGGRVDLADLTVRDGAADELDEQLVPRRRDVVDERRGARDVLAGRVDRDRRPEHAARSHVDRIGAELRRHRPDAAVVPVTHGPPRATVPRRGRRRTSAGCSRPVASGGRATRGRRRSARPPPVPGGRPRGRSPR